MAQEADDVRHQDNESSQLDFSLFHRELPEERLNKMNTMRTHVKVKQFTAGNQQNGGGDEEELVDQLQNFTFDLSLGGDLESESNGFSDSMMLSGHPVFVNQALASNAEAADENDQIDELYRELQELIGKRQETESSKMLAESSLSEPISPYEPEESENLTQSLPAANL